MNKPDASFTGTVEESDLGLPGGDNPAAVSAVLNEVLALSEVVHSNLADIVRRHEHTAPLSSQHVVDLIKAVAFTFVDWIARWPE